MHGWMCCLEIDLYWYFTVSIFGTSSVFFGRSYSSNVVFRGTTVGIMNRNIEAQRAKTFSIDSTAGGIQVERASQCFAAIPFEAVNNHTAAVRSLWPRLGQPHRLKRPLQRETMPQNKSRATLRPSSIH